jgi:hypothetical protein
VVPVKVESNESTTDQIEVQYVSSNKLTSDPIFSEFEDIFAAFTTPEELCAPKQVAAI